MGRCCFTSPQGENWGHGTLIKAVTDIDEDTVGCFVRDTIERLNSLLKCSKGAASIDDQLILKVTKSTERKSLRVAELATAENSKESKMSTNLWTLTILSRTIIDNHGRFTQLRPHFFEDATHGPWIRQVGRDGQRNTAGI